MKSETSTPAFPQFTGSHENWLTMWFVICCMLCFGLPCRGGGWVIDQLGIHKIDLVEPQKTANTEMTVLEYVPAFLIIGLEKLHMTCMHYR